MNAIREFLECLLGTLQVVVAVAMTVPMLLVPLIPVIVFIIWATYLYIQASRELKRMESVYKSPGTRGRRHMHVLVHSHADLMLQCLFCSQRLFKD
jgi:hypothetical protein